METKREEFLGVVYSVRREGRKIRLKTWPPKVPMFHGRRDDLTEEFTLNPMVSRFYRKLDGKWKQWTPGNYPAWSPLEFDEPDQDWAQTLDDSGTVTLRGEGTNVDTFLVWHQPQRPLWKYGIPGQIIVSPDDKCPLWYPNVKWPLLPGRFFALWGDPEEDRHGRLVPIPGVLPSETVPYEIMRKAQATRPLH